MNSNFQKDNEERNADLHLMISEKYMAYRELADRCFLSRAADCKCFHNLIFDLY
jgi:hypothetical protein